ncbi:MAG: hypothetical protein CVV23_16955 [Ignavibacteriae bacterium HGW-Ignavibacteriae-2]|jgi:RNA polymerase sigma factor (sigma-70 family)|nr:MAG: hypothetical protein CVV23_16955 [Ignavibacteriae bacterium HGW-Ignavibacteriae-2]
MEIAKEQEIINRIHEGDSSAEEELIKLLYPRVKMIVGSRVAEHEVRREIINDIFVSVILKIRDGSYENERESTLISYLNGVARFKIQNYYRRYYRKIKMEVNYSEEFTDNKELYDYIKLDVEENEEIEQNKKFWKEMINKLKPKYKNVLFLRYYDDLSVIEIGNKLNISPQKVSDYLKYSKQLLLKEISENKNENIF